MRDAVSAGPRPCDLLQQFEQQVALAQAQRRQQFTLGVEHCCGSSDFAFAPAVGVDIPVNRMLNVRAQVDFRTVMLTDSHVNEQRYWFGVSLPVGAK